MVVNISAIMMQTRITISLLAAGLGITHQHILLAAAALAMHNVIAALARNAVVVEGKNIANVKWLEDVSVLHVQVVVLFPMHVFGDVRVFANVQDVIRFVKTYLHVHHVLVLDVGIIMTMHVAVIIVMIL